MKLWRWIPFLLVLMCHAAPAACPPEPVPASAQALRAAAQSDRGLLWALRRDGRTSYLFGTLHVGRPQWLAPGPKLRAAIAATEVLALELDPTDPEVQREIAAAPDQTPPLPAALKQRLARQLQRACLDGALPGNLHPGLAAMLLAIGEARRAGLDPAFAQEVMLLAAARGRRVVSLETAALQKDLLMPDDPATLAALVEQTLQPLEDGRGPQVIGRLAGAWAAGDLATLERYEQWCDCVQVEADRTAMRALVDDRNPAMAARIAALHAEGRPLLAAVGALHMTGPNALPRLLAAAGFEVERVAFGAQ